MTVTTGEALGAAIVAGLGAEATGITNYTGLGSDDSDDNSDDSSGTGANLGAILAATQSDGGLSDAVVAQLLDSAQSGGRTIIERQAGYAAQQAGAASDGAEAALRGNYDDLVDRAGLDSGSDGSTGGGSDDSGSGGGRDLPNRLAYDAGNSVGNLPFSILGGAIDAGAAKAREHRAWIGEQFGVDEDRQFGDDDNPGLADVPGLLSEGSDETFARNNLGGSDDSDDSAPMPGGSGGDPDSDSSGSSSSRSSTPSAPKSTVSGIGMNSVDLSPTEPENDPDSSGSGDGPIANAITAGTNWLGGL